MKLLFYSILIALIVSFYGCNSTKKISKIGPIKIESSIQKSELGINPQTDGQIIRLRIPDLTEERRKDLIKILKNMGEKGKIAIRNIRREANEELKKKLKGKSISEDENKNFEKNIQKLTDSNIDTIEKILAEKEKEIGQI